MSQSTEVTAGTLQQFVGSWRLVSFEMENQATGERGPGFGPNPKGRLVALPSGVVIVVMTGSGRAPPKSPEDRANAFNTTVAYTGHVSVSGDQFVTQVDISWNEGWVGTAQARTFRFVGPKLELVSAWAPSPFAPDSIGRGVLLWERES